MDLTCHWQGHNQEVKMNETILIIEDDKDFAESLKLKLEEAGLSNAVSIINDFASGLNQLDKSASDVVVLDIFEGEPRYDKREGMPIWERVWNKLFIPIVIASASRLDELMEYAERHPLIRYVVKSDSDAMNQIIEGISQFLPFGKGIKEIRNSLFSDTEQTVQKALTETAPNIPKIISEPNESFSLLKSAARRRLANLMRLESERERANIFAWEQYLYPPPDVPYLLTGDVLAVTSGNRSSPESFCVVLTPSCDLAQKKVGYVLVGRCVPLREFYSKNNLPPLTSQNNKKKASDKLSTMLTQAQANGYAILPAYSDMIPPMAVSLRSLELLSIKDGIKATSADGKEFERVISIDNPFREQMSWAYLQISGRLGMPDRNIEAWIDEILKTVKQ